MNIHVKLFGSLAELTGKSNLIVGGCTDTQSLVEKLTIEFPQIKNSLYVISVNKKIVKNNQNLEPGNEVALLPPFAGG